MLGMMNSPTDAVEFYATNQSVRQGISDEDLKTFTEAKPRQTITYTKDGRRMIDGKIEDVQSGAAMVLWGNTLLRGAVRTHMKVQDVEKNEKPDETPEEETKETESEPSTEPKGEYVQIIEIVEHPVLANAPASEQPPQ
ncbi:hypothetical protein ANCCAN_09290 [Ancylostoma caninum]|uniref:Uncharacterized protein n=1 Tax=Ancylostoma caninum TaxID=29170 RepID=A0A368GNZ6_ANCCA|nr:hypothetical protein ANCCAN_09290 [Ancylostoma caninum]